MSGLWRVRTAITGGSGAAQVSTMFFDQSAGLLVQDAANAVRAFWDSIKGNISTAYTMQVELAVETIESTTGKPTSISAVTAAPVVGTNAGDPNPWMTQGLISWRTGVFVAGREIRGRTFIPGTTESINTNGVPAAGYLTNLNAAAVTLSTDPLSAFIIYSRKNFGVGVVASGQAWTKWAVLRSRRD